MGSLGVADAALVLLMLMSLGMRGLGSLSREASGADKPRARDEHGARPRQPGTPPHFDFPATRSRDWTQRAPLGAIGMAAVL